MVANRKLSGYTVTRNTAISDFDLHYTIYIYTNGPLKSRSGSWLDINDEKILKINSEILI